MMPIRCTRRIHPGIVRPPQCLLGIDAEGSREADPCLQPAPDQVGRLGAIGPFLELAQLLRE